MNLRFLIVATVLAASLLALVCALAVSRSHLFAGAVRFMPADADFLVSASSVESAWKLLEPHVKRIDRGAPCGEDDGPRSKTLRDLLRQVRCGLRGRTEAPLSSLAGLRSIGIDTSRSFAVALGNLGGSGDPDILLAVPLSDGAKFAAWLRQEPVGRDGKPQVPECGTGRERGHFCFVVPDRAFALVMTRGRWMEPRERVQGSDWTSDDTIAELLRSARTGNGKAAQSITLTLTTPTPIAAVVFGDTFRLRLRARAAMGAPVSNTMRSFLAPIDRSAAGSAGIADRLPIAVNLAGDNLGQRLDYVREFAPDLLDKIDGWLVRDTYSFQPVLPALAKSKTVTAITAGVVDFDHSLPRFVIAAEEQRAQSEELVRKLQLSNARRRFDALHARIADCVRNAAANVVVPMPVCPRRPDPTIDETADESDTPGLPRLSSWSMEEERLVRAELLANDHDEFIFGGEPSGTMFEGSRYRGCLEPMASCPTELQHTYVAPPFNENDFKWLLGSPSAAEKDRLHAGAYRFTSLYEPARTTLWFALDAATLRTALATAEEHGHERRDATLRFHADPKFLWAQLLNSEKEADKFARQLAADLRAYRRLDLAVVPLGEPAGLLAEASLEY